MGTGIKGGEPCSESAGKVRKRPKSPFALRRPVNRGDRDLTGAGKDGRVYLERSNIWQLPKAMF